MTLPPFLTVSGSPITGSGTLAVSYSGTAIPTSSGGTGLTTVGTTGQVLTSNGTILSWQTPPSGGVTSIGITVPSFMSVTPATITTSGTFVISATSTGTGRVVLATSPTLITPILGVASATSLTLSTALATSSGGTGLTTIGTTGQVLTSNGTVINWQTPTSGVTSIGMTVPSFMSVTPATITTSGTFAISATSTGTGSVVLATSPTLITPILGTASATSLTLSTPLAASSGGTGLTTVGTTGQVLTSNGTILSWQTPAGTGSVSSVGMTVPSFMSVTPDTITTSGTFAISATSTGTGSVVLATSPTITSPTVNTSLTVNATSYPVFINVSATNPYWNIQSYAANMQVGGTYANLFGRNNSGGNYFAQGFIYAGNNDPGNGAYITMGNTNFSVYNSGLATLNSQLQVNMGTSGGIADAAQFLGSAATATRISVGQSFTVGNYGYANFVYVGNNNASNAYKIGNGIAEMTLSNNGSANFNCPLSTTNGNLVLNVSTGQATPGLSLLNASSGTGGAQTYQICGVANSNLNAAFMNFQNYGTGSSSNAMAIGLLGSAQLQINTTSATSSVPLIVTGFVKASPYYFTNGGTVGGTLSYYMSTAVVVTSGATVLCNYLTGGTATFSTVGTPSLTLIGGGGGFVASYTGTYLINVSTWFAAASGGTNNTLYVYINGSVVEQQDIAGTQYGCRISTVRNLQNGDIVTVYVYNGAIGTQTLFTIPTKSTKITMSLLYQ